MRTASSCLKILALAGLASWFAAFEASARPGGGAGYAGGGRGGALAIRGGGIGRFGYAGRGFGGSQFVPNGIHSGPRFVGAGTLGGYPIGEARRARGGFGAGYGGYGDAGYGGYGGFGGYGGYGGGYGPGFGSGYGGGGPAHPGHVGSVGIRPSPVLPPAVYVIGSGRTGTMRRPGSTVIGASSAEVAGESRVAASAGPRVVQVRPNRP